MGRAEEVRVGKEGVRGWMFKMTPPTFMHSVGRGQNDPMLFEDGLVFLIFLNVFFMMGRVSNLTSLPPPPSCMVHFG